MRKTHLRADNVSENESELGNFVAPSWGRRAKVLTSRGSSRKLNLFVTRARKGPIEHVFEGLALSERLTHAQ